MNLSVTSFLIYQTASCSSSIRVNGQFGNLSREFIYHGKYALQSGNPVGLCTIELVHGVLMMIDIEELESWIEHGETDRVMGILQGSHGVDDQNGSGWESSDPRILYLESLLEYRAGYYRNALDLLSEASELAASGKDRKLEYRIINTYIWLSLKIGRSRGVRELFRKIDRKLDRADKRSRADFFVNHAYGISRDIGFIESEKFSDDLVKNAHEVLDEADRIAGRKFPTVHLKMCLTRGLLLQQEESWEKAEKVLKEGKESAQRERYVFLQAELLEEQGNLRLRLADELRRGEPDRAMELYGEAGNSFKEALDIWQGSNMDEEGVLNSAIGDVSYRLGEYQEAKDHHSKALQIFEDLDYPHGIALQQDALGRVLLRQGEIKDGIRYLKKAYKGFRKLKVKHETVLCRVHLVDGYFLLSRNKGKSELRKLLYNEPVKRYRDCYRELKEVVTREDWLREDEEFGELFQKPLPRYITLEVLEEIILAAKKAHPNEFGALLHGDPIMDRLEFVLDSARGKATFMFSLYNRYSGDYIYADGSVHSHPSGAAVPSAADLSFFGRFPAVNIIIGFPYTLDSWAAYDRTGNRVKVKIIYRDYKGKVEKMIEKLEK